MASPNSNTYTAQTLYKLQANGSETDIKTFSAFGKTVDLLFPCLTFANIGNWVTILKQFTLCYQTIVCLSLTLMYCGQTVGWIKVKLGTEVDLGPGHIMLDGDPAPLSEMGTAPPPFSAHVCCGQLAGWIKVPLGTEVDRGPGDKKRAQAPTNFGPCIVAKRLHGSRCHLVLG